MIEEIKDNFYEVYDFIVGNIITIFLATAVSGFFIIFGAFFSVQEGIKNCEKTSVLLKADTVYSCGTCYVSLGGIWVTPGEYRAYYLSKNVTLKWRGITCRRITITRKER